MNAPDRSAARKRKPTKADLAAQPARATAALYAEPGRYTATEPTRMAVTIYA